MSYPERIKGKVKVRVQLWGGEQVGPGRKNCPPQKNYRIRDRGSVPHGALKFLSGDLWAASGAAEDADAWQVPSLATRLILKAGRWTPLQHRNN